MEVDSVKDMFVRSVENYNVKYTRYIGDGDSATFKGLLDLNPYDVPIEKLECYLHEWGWKRAAEMKRKKSRV